MKNQLNVSLICPVHNEELTISKTIDSIFSQSKIPREIIFIEDSSTDKTFEVLKKFAKKRKNIRIFQVKNKNISKNRNLAIKKSKGDLIVCVDAGCIFSKDYIMKITLPFENEKVFFVGGISKISQKNLFDKCFAYFVVKENPSKNYLPKGHAMAFRKKMWKIIGGFPEDLALGAEDTFFGKKALKFGYAPVIVKDAVVYWENRKDLEAVFKQFRSYGYWDGKAFKLKELPVNSKLSLLIAIIFPLAILHALIKGTFLFFKLKKLKAIYYGMAIDLSKIYGYFFGFCREIYEGQ